MVNILHIFLSLFLFSLFFHLIPIFRHLLYLTFISFSKNLRFYSKMEHFLHF